MRKVKHIPVEPIVRTVTNFGELSFPTPIYKYRDWENPLHKNILLARELFFAPPSSFLPNDPTDCRLPLRFDLMSNNDKKQWLYDLSLQRNPEWSASVRNKYAQDWRTKTRLNDKAFIKEFQENYFGDLDKWIGVLSMTANPTNFKMWEAYANNHTGICVGYNSEILFRPLGGAQHCQYYHSNQQPILLPTAKSNFSQFRQQVFSKRIKFDYEEEYRVIRYKEDFFQSTQERVYNPELNAYHSIILGQNNPNLNEIKEILKGDFAGVNIILQRAIVEPATQSVILQPIL
jgi:hypothetical protein